MKPTKALRLLILAGCLAAPLFILAGPSPASAAPLLTEVYYDTTYTFDNGWEGWDPTIQDTTPCGSVSHATPDDAIISSSYEPGGDQDSPSGVPYVVTPGPQGGIGLVFAQPVRLFAITAWMNTDNVDGWLDIYFCDDMDSLAWSYSTIIGPYNAFYTRFEPNELDIQGVYIFAAGYDPAPDSGKPGIYGLLDDITLEVYSDWGTPWPESEASFVRPVTSSDTLQVDDIDPALPDIIHTVFNAPVYSSTGGTVTGVAPISNGYGVRVDLTTDDGYVTTYSNLSQTFVTVGDTVSPGCLIGYAGPAMNTDDPDLLSESAIGFGVKSNGVFLDWQAWEEPSGYTVCGSAWRTDNCINNNPTLENKSKGWTRVLNGRGEGPQVELDRVILKGGTGLSQYILIESPEASYTVSVAVTPRSSSAEEMTVYLGNDYSSAVIQGNAYNQQLYEFTLEPTAGNYGDIYELKIVNTDNLSPGYGVEFICLNTGAALVSPPPCLFEDPAFDSESGWTYGADAERVWYSFLYPNDYVALFYDGVNSYTYDDGISFGAWDANDTDFNLQFVYQLDAFNSSTDTPLTLDFIIDDVIAGPVTLATFDNMVSNIWPLKITVPFTVTAGTEYSGDAYFQVQDTWSATTGYVRLSRVCVSPADGNWPLPGGAAGDWDYVIGSSGDSAIYNIEIIQADIPGECPAPTDLDTVGPWIAWLVCKLEAMQARYIEPNISQATSLIDKLLQAVGYFGLWLGLLIWHAMDWLGTLTLYALNLLANSTVLILSQLLEGIFGLDIFEFLIGLLDLVELALQTVRDILALGVGLFVASIKVLSSIIEIIGFFWSAFVSAINDPTVTDLGVSFCADEEGQLYAACAGLQMVNYVITDAPALAVAGYAASTLLAMRFIFMTLKKIGDAAGQLG